MAKQVWICDFCSTTHDTEKEVLKHEECCSFNPALRGCYTCGNSKEGVPSDIFGTPSWCRHDHEQDGEYHPDVVNCKLWEPEE